LKTRQGGGGASGFPGVWSPFWTASDDLSTSFSRYLLSFILIDNETPASEWNRGEPMDLKHLQALVGIADTGSFSAAAASIGTVQSNVSAHVARLERELEVELVDRASGRLTEEGEVVVARARQMLAEL